MNALKIRLNAHFAACAAVAATAVAAAPQQAEAAIVYSGPVSISIPATTAGVYLNVVTGANSTAPASAPGWDLNPWNSSSLSWFNPSAPAGGVYVTGGGSSATLVDNLALGALIDGSSVYGSGISETTGATSFNLNSDNNYVGFRFQNEAAGNQTQYGWVQVHIGASMTDPARAIIGYAYENTGAGINVGAGAPAPGALALLGLAGLVGSRRRRVA